MSACLAVSSPTSLPHAIIVDDEQSYLDLLAVILGEHLTCPVATFSRPADALAAMADLNVGVIVTDFYMPDMDGIEFLRRAELMRPGVPAIIITGHSEALAERSFEGMPQLRSILAKPFGAKLLADTIRQHFPGAGAPNA